MSNTIKKAYNSKPASVLKNILTGIGVITIGIALIAGVIFLGPVVVAAILTVIQFAAWGIAFCLIILLPLWLIGKFIGCFRNNRKSSRFDKTKEDYIKEMKDLKKHVEILKRGKEVN